MPRVYRTARGEQVDVDLLKIKQQLAGRKQIVVQPVSQTIESTTEPTPITDSTTPLVGAVPGTPAPIVNEVTKVKKDKSKQDD